MPQRPPVAVTRRRDGKGNETIYSPGAAMIYVKATLKRSVGDSTLRMWRKINAGPTYHKDRYGFVWYRESDLRKFFLGRNQMETLDQELVVEQSDLHEADAVPEREIEGLFDIRPVRRAEPKKKLISARPRLGAETATKKQDRPRLSA